jgi:2-amino-4-hydroxy-6-hydroxymethyldihydropteridine diphosphokinase
MIAAIALGSNLPSHFGPPEANLHEALHRLASIGDITAVSTFHATDPVGYADQPRFLNAAALLETTLSPLALLHALLSIEQAMGRDRSTAPPKGPRMIYSSTSATPASPKSSQPVPSPSPILRCTSAASSWPHSQK